MRSSNLIFIAGLIFILLTDTIFWIQLKQYLNKKSVSYTHLTLPTKA